MLRLTRIVLALFVLLFGLAAFADDVPPAPKNCPPGSTGHTNHGGPYCAPNTCKTDADCNGGAVCTEQPLCVESQTYTTGRMPDEKPKTRQNATKVCDAGNTCAAPATCEVAKRCVIAAKKEPAPKEEPPKEAPPKESTSKEAPKEAPPKEQTAPAEKSGGCAVSIEDNTALSFLMLLGGLLVLRRRGKRALS